jgi:hypothetical protein
VTQPLNLKCGILVSSLCFFECNLYRYSAVRMREVLSHERANDIAEQHLDLNRHALEAQRLNLNVITESNSIHSQANCIAATVGASPSLSPPYTLSIFSFASSFPHPPFLLTVCPHPPSLILLLF